MAAEIQPRPLSRKPVLLSKIEGFQDVVNSAVIIPKEDGVISVSQDSGLYMYVIQPRDKEDLCRPGEWLCIGEFVLSEDYNRMTPARTYQAHQSGVTVVLFVLEMEWVLSTGQDKSFTWHCSESGQQLGTYRTTAWVSGLQFDVETRHAFIGDYSGQVTILKLEQDNCRNVTALCWDPVQRFLFSGSSDHSIILWDIGGRKGTAIELQGHNDKVQGLCYAPHTRQLISSGSDGGIVIWNMDVTRQEHHCRKCGQAVCGKCSSKRSTIPLMGFEFEVRVCDGCHDSITEEERAPTASFHDSKHSIIYMQYEATRGWLLTSGTDKVIKLWDMTPVVS
ncbi:hypothetical protein DNTS_005423 [Danionella cerebrum]|uniref:FYVE-type domain-containing protein n=1 Tax=Danionella cerebrum TaxID=2873325 RepID=A0A553RKM8_9TELE|nr:hypothetical protein DNTS_005423 [Danionella translucida]